MKILKVKNFSDPEHGAPAVPMGFDMYSEDPMGGYVREPRQPSVTPAPEGWQEFVDATRNLFEIYGRDYQALFDNTNPPSGAESYIFSLNPSTRVTAFVQDGQVVLNEQSELVQVFVAAGVLDPDQTWDVQEFYDTLSANVDTSNPNVAGWFTNTDYGTYPPFSIEQMEAFGVNISMLPYVLGYESTSQPGVLPGASFDLADVYQAALENPNFTGQYDWMENTPEGSNTFYNFTAEIIPNSPLYVTQSGSIGNYYFLAQNLVSVIFQILEPDLTVQYGASGIALDYASSGTFYDYIGSDNPVINAFGYYFSLASVYTNPYFEAGGLASIYSNYLDLDTLSSSEFWDSVVAWFSENPQITGIYDPSTGESLDILEVFYSEGANNYGFDGFAPPPETLAQPDAIQQALMDMVASGNNFDMDGNGLLDDADIQGIMELFSPNEDGTFSVGDSVLTLEELESAIGQFVADNSSGYVVDGVVISWDNFGYTPTAESAPPPSPPEPTETVDTTETVETTDTGEVLDPLLDEEGLPPEIVAEMGAFVPKRMRVRKRIRR